MNIILFLISSIVFILGLICMIYSSKYAIKHSVLLATILGISPLIIGVTLVSIGTDISEIFNSLISSSIGHADIDVGDSIGSNFTQLTLIFGLLPIICGAFHIERKKILVLGTCEISALIIVFCFVSTGYITRIYALIMVFSLLIYFFIIYKSDKKGFVRDHNIDISDKKSKKYHLLIAVIGFVGVAISSFFVIQSTITISKMLNIEEYIMSFFILAIGTSLPELIVDVQALRTGNIQIAIGDIIGSCIVDASLSIGIGMVFFPQAVSIIAIPTILYTIFASVIVVLIIAIRQKIDKKTGILFILLYLSSYFLIFI